MSTYSPGRRRFVQLMGWAGAATIAGGGPALGQAAARSRTTAKPEKPHAAAAPAAADSTAAAKGPSEEAKALAEAFRRRYPDRVTDQELALITKDFDGDLQGIAALRKTKLANSDEPDVTFHA
jgi:hypothetical protein